MLIAISLKVQTIAEKHVLSYAAIAVRRRHVVAAALPTSAAAYRLTTTPFAYKKTQAVDN